MPVPIDGNDIVQFTGKMKKETEKAVLFLFMFPDSDAIEAWIPYSQISYLHIDKNGGKDRIKIPKWIARSKHLSIDGDEEEVR